MNQKITYEELLNLSIDEFNARKNKSIYELLLYLYFKSSKEGYKGYIFNYEEVYKAFVDQIDMVGAIESAFNELIDETDDESVKTALMDFQYELVEEHVKIDSPVQYYCDEPGTLECFQENLDFFFEYFDVLNHYGYDFSKFLEIEENEGCGILYTDYM